jgi:hypothetical protein
LLAMFFHGCDPFIVKLDQHIQLWWLFREINKIWSEQNGAKFFYPFEQGLPDFSCYNIPKRRKICQITMKLWQRATKYTT